MPDVEDPHAWLEDVDGTEAMAWVHARNAEVEADLFVAPGFAQRRAAALAILEAEDRIEQPSRHGEVVFDVWTDAAHPRGLLRRTTWDEYRAGSPAWEVVLDVGALGAAEGESWVLAGVSIRRPDRTRALIELSPGGSDATVTRELDLASGTFVAPADGGFERPLAKGSCAWIEDDAVYVMTDLGPDTTTRSGYPRTVRRWARGQALTEAPVVFSGAAADIAVSAHLGSGPGPRRHLVQRALDFYTAEHHLLVGDDWVRIPVPIDVDVDVHSGWLTFRPRLDWTIASTTHPGGSLLAAPVEGFLAGTADPVSVFAPTEHRALVGATWTAHHLVLEVLDDVRCSIEVATPPAGGGGWTVGPLADAPDTWTAHVRAVDADERDDIWLSTNDLLSPEAQRCVPVGAEGGSEVLRRAPTRFDADDLRIEQHWATSTDGTPIPYFQVSRADADGAGPTLLGGYGGFEMPRMAEYAPVVGKLWLEAGHTYALANIRGGGEFGPAWHRAGLREHRHRVYEDFEAVARDLLDRGVTTPAELGCTGGSNGGLLVGNMYVRCPELWGAIVCQVPLLDMHRYPHLLAGASWMAEYGDPDDPDDWAFLSRWSPYQLVEADRAYPPMLLTTSTRDDRVHPGHARKMAARLRELGHPVDYWENVEGGHGGAADAPQQATVQALIHTFLHRHLVAQASG